MNTAIQKAESLLSAKEVSVILGVAERTTLRLMASGQLESFKLNGKLWRTTHSRVAAYQRREFQRYRSAIAA